MKLYNQKECELSTKLFAIHTSYLKGKCLNLVKSLAKSRDGFQLGRELHKEFEPSTRQSVLAYEQLVSQFEGLSATSYPSALKSATIIKCSDAKLREHIQVTVEDTTTYAQLREVVLNYEKVPFTSAILWRSMRQCAELKNVSDVLKQMKCEQLWNWRIGFVLSNLKTMFGQFLTATHNIRTVGTHFVDPPPMWSVNFKYRTTLVQKVSTAEENHGWIVAEVSGYYLELDMHLAIILVKLMLKEKPA